MTDTATSQIKSRVSVLDVARGVALVAMAIYHFAWDLEFFGWLAPATALTGGWLIFARCIASSFLFLVGVSLVLAHADGIRWSAFWKRFLQIAGAAALISAATGIALDNGLIFFGILHAIALFSLIGLLMVARPWYVPLVLGAIVLGIWSSFDHPLFELPALWWVGLAAEPPRANDYVPMFPWLAPTLFGMAASRLMLDGGLWTKLGRLKVPTPVQRPLGFLGRHSLVFYLIHQPILIGLIWAFTNFIAAPDQSAQFVSQCRTSCAMTRDGPFCQSYCDCMVDEMKQAQVFTPFMRRQLSDDQNALILEKRDMCVARSQ